MCKLVLTDTGCQLPDKEASNAVQTVKTLLISCI